jgi:hypothetical protein
VGTWHDAELGRPIAAPLERCAQLLGVDLATICELAAEVEPYIRADGTSIWSLMQLERRLRPRPTAGGGAATSTADGPWPPMHSTPRRPPLSASFLPPLRTERRRGVRTLFGRAAPAEVLGAKVQ